MVQFAYVRQKEMRGLGHAILQARNLVGDEPFVVMTPDDVFSGGPPATKALIDVYNVTQAPVIGVQKVPKEQLHLYGIVSGTEEEGKFRVSNVVEKPTAEEAPSNYATCGRYLLFPEIFEILAELPPGHGGEIQIADANNELARLRPMYAAKIEATYHDAGSKLGYLQAVVEFALERDDLGADFHAYLKERLKR